MARRVNEEKKRIWYGARARQNASPDMGFASLALSGYPAPRRGVEMRDTARWDEPFGGFAAGRVVPLSDE
jgi:hypothetical protein